MMKSYKNLMNQFLFAGNYLKENKDILTNIYNKIQEDQELEDKEFEYLINEKENILLLKKLNIKGCPNALQTLSNDLSETITEYMDWDKLGDSKIAAIIQKKMKSEVESYTMLTGNGKSNNRKALSEFNSSKSNKKKFMFVMDMLNEGVHVEDVDGIVWFRPLSENSKILFMQQLGRCITAIGKDDKDRIPQIIDLVNNTLKVNLENSEENQKEDLQQIKNINSWIEKNKRMPIEDSNNIEEQINYNSLKLLKRKYNKYLDDNLLEKKPLKKKIIIKEIIQIGSNFDLWNYEFISKDKSDNNPKNSGNEKKDLLSVFKIKGVLRNFSDLYSEVEELTLTLTDEEKLLEYLQAMKDNDNRIIPYNSSLLFSDGKKMNQYWNNKEKIYKMITEEGNQFVAQYKDQCEVLIKEYNKKQLSEEEKLFEYLQAMKENGNRIISTRSSLLFSNGEKMGYYWNNKKDKIYEMIIEEGNPFVEQYKNQCKVLIKEYNNYQEKLEIKITDEEKLLEYLQAIKENGNKIIRQRDKNKTFSNNEKMGTYWNGNKDKIYKMITEEGNPFIVQYKEQCEVLIKEYNKKKLSSEEKLLEYLEAVKKNGNRIISTRSSLLFSDGIQMAQYWQNSKDKIYKIITEEGNQFIVQYKEQCEVLIKEYNKKQLSEEEKLLEYLKAIKDNENKIIPFNSSLLFSNGEKMGYYWNNKKDKIYEMIIEEGNQFIVQYKDQCEVLNKEYNKKQLSEEEKLFEYLQAMKANGNKIISSTSSLLFSDGIQMSQYWQNNKDKIYKMITEEGNQFIVQYKDQCEVLIKEYNNYQEKLEIKITAEEKFLEYLQAIKDNDNKMISSVSKKLFSDGTQMKQYWNGNKDKIYKMITEEGNPFVAQYKEQCEVLVKEYNNNQKRQEKKLTDEEKLLEYLQAMKENDNRIISTRSSLLFSDGEKMGTYWQNNKDKIYKMITEEGNPFIIQYKEQCEVLIKEYNKKALSDEEKLLEYLQAMKTNSNKIIPQSSSLLFSDGTQMKRYWSANKDKIYEMITEEGNRFIVKYKDQCEVLIKEYNKKKLSDEEKLFEYLQAMKDNENKIIPKSSSLLFSDGTKMGTYWKDNKDKIYEMITEEENPFVIHYKNQCEVLINKYILFQEKRKKKKEKYDKVEEEFREKSSFDKVLADEIGKGPNEDGKVL